jgi:hypothetical protein
MSAVELNRREFLQWGAVAGCMVSQGFPSWAQAADATPALRPQVTTDPFLQLALMHGFEDHALQAWPMGMRLSVVLDQIDRSELAQKLGADVHIQTLFDDAGFTWATLSLQKDALLRLHRQGMGEWFQSHLWGAPWRHSEDRFMSWQAGWAEPKRVRVQPGKGQPDAAGRRQRFLVIDHGFPLSHLSDSGLSYLHLASHANNRAEALTHAYSHGAQTLGLLLQSNIDRVGHDHLPLLLCELPDALLGSMPLGALWPDVLDAVHWGVNNSEPGDELVILLSVVSSDGNRDPQSFVTLSAQAMQRHARALGVDLKWVMAAGNQHHAQQHLRYQVLPGQAAEWQWQLPVDNAQASFLECWHDARAGMPEVFFKAPNGQWQSSGHGVTSAWRSDSSSKIQTVFRLPATHSGQASQSQALAGAWGGACAGKRQGASQTLKSISA